MPVNNLITVRKGSASSWTSSGAILASGEPGFDTTNKIFKVGDGVSNWSSLLNQAVFSDLDVISTVSGATLFNVEGTNGSLFSVVDNLSGTLMSVNNNAGLPVFEVFSDDRIVGGRFGFNDFVLTSSGNLGVGTSSPSGKLDIIGDVYVRNAANSSGVIYFKSSGIADTALKIRTDNFGNLYCDAGALGPIIKLGNQDGQADIFSSSAWITIGQNYNANNGNQYVRFTPSNTEIMRVFSTGVGIGTTSPRGTLDVTGGLKAGGYSDVVPGSGSELIISNANSVVGVPNTNTAGIVLQHNGFNTVYIRSNPTNFRIGNNAGDALVMTHSNRRIGIGITSPTNRFEVEHTITSNTADAIAQFGTAGNPAATWANSAHQVIIGGPSVANYTGLIIYSDSTSGLGLLSFADGRGASDSWRGYLEYGHVDNSMRFGTNAAERMRITSTGAVGIGTVSPTGALHVNGTAIITGEITATIDGGGVT